MYLYFLRASLFCTTLNSFNAEFDRFGGCFRTPVHIAPVNNGRKASGPFQTSNFTFAESNANEKKSNCFRSFELDSAYVKFDVLNPYETGLSNV